MVTVVTRRKGFLCLVWEAFDAAAASKNITMPEDVDLYAFVSSTAANLFVGLTLFLVFCFLRTRVRCYSARHIVDSRRPVPFSGFFGWLPLLLKADDESVYVHSGLDALIYVKFFSRCFKLFLAASVGAVVVLLVNVFGGEGQVAFGAIAVSNVREGSHMLVCHVVAIYGFTFLCFFFLHQTYSDFTAWRHRWLAEQQPTTARSIMVTCLPKFCRTQQEFEEFFRSLFKEEFESAAISIYSKHRIKLFKQREKALDKLEKALASLIETGERPQSKLRGWCQSLYSSGMGEPLLREEHGNYGAIQEDGQKKGVDTIHYYSARIRMLNDQIKHVEVPTTATAGFVTFTTLRAAHEAARVILDGTPFSFKCRLAPETRDVCWENLDENHRAKKVRNLVGFAMVAAVCLFSTIPITAIAAVTTLPNLVKFLPSWLASAINNSEPLSGFLSGFLPSLANIIFLAMLPSILLAIAKFDGLESFSWIERRMARYFFLFVVLTIFIAQTLANSLLNTLKDLATISDLIDLLANSIPKFGYFFAIFILMQAFVRLPIALVDPVTLIRWVVIGKFAKTERAVLAAEMITPIFYGVEYSNHLLVFVIVVSYAIIQPIIVVFATIYFAVAYLIAKYKVMFVAIPKYESGGMFWPNLFTHMCVGLFVSQLTLVGVLGLKQVPVEAGCLFPLPFLTLGFWNYVREEFLTLSKSLPFSEMMGERKGDAAPSNVYLCPAMNPESIPIPTVEDAKLVQNHGRSYYVFGDSVEEKNVDLSKSD